MFNRLTGSSVLFKQYQANITGSIIGGVPCCVPCIDSLAASDTRSSLESPAHTLRLAKSSCMCILRPLSCLIHHYQISPFRSGRIVLIEYLLNDLDCVIFLLRTTSCSTETICLREDACFKSSFEYFCRFLNT